MTPWWLADLLAVLMIATAVYCAGRLALVRVRRRTTEHDVDVVHIGMGVAMAGMLVTRLDPFGNAVWQVIFSLATAWFVARLLVDLRAGRSVRHHVPHLATSGAMLYMLTAMPVRSPSGGQPASGMSMSGMRSMASAGQFPVVALGLALFMVGYVVWALDRLSVSPLALVSTGHSTSGSGSPGLPFLAPRSQACCHIVMAIVMGYMLVTML